MRATAHVEFFYTSNKRVKQSIETKGLLRDQKNQKNIYSRKEVET